MKINGPRIAESEVSGIFPSILLASSTSKPVRWGYPVWSIRIARKLKATDVVIDVLADLFILRGIPAHIVTRFGFVFSKTRSSRHRFNNRNTSCRFHNVQLRQDFHF